MAISYNSTLAYAFGSTGNTTAFNTLSTNRSRLLVVTLQGETDRTPSYVRYGGQDLTLAKSVINTNLTAIVHIYYALEATLAAAANTNITIGYSTSTTVSVHVADFYDVRQEAPFADGSNFTGNGSTSATVTLAMETQGQLVVYTCMNSTDGATWTPASGFIELQDTDVSGYSPTTIYGISTNGGNWGAYSTSNGSGFITAVACAWRDLEEAGFPVWFN